MVIFKIILFILAIISLYRTITEDNTKKAYEYLFYTMLYGFFAIFLLPI